MSITKSGKYLSDWEPVFLSHLAISPEQFRRNMERELAAPQTPPSAEQEAIDRNQWLRFHATIGEAPNPRRSSADRSLWLRFHALKSSSNPT